MIFILVIIMDKLKVENFLYSPTTTLHTILFMHFLKIKQICVMKMYSSFAKSLAIVNESKNCYEVAHLSGTENDL